MALPLRHDRAGGFYDGILTVLSGPEPLLLTGIFAVIAWWLRGLPAAVLTFLGFALIDSIEQWHQTMQSLSLVLVACIITIAVAVPSVSGPPATAPSAERCVRSWT